MQAPLGAADANRTAVLNKVAAKVGAKDADWHSYNNNVRTTTKVADLVDIENQAVLVLTSFNEHNAKNPERKLVAVPISGWTPKGPTEGVGGFFSCFGNREKKDRVDDEYGASYSFNPYISTPGADLILQVAYKAHYIIPVKGKPDQFKVSAGVQVVEFENHLRKLGKAAPSASTLTRAAWTGGLGTGFYWPSKVDGPGSTHILKAKIVDGKGNKLKLSPKDKHHPNLFHALIHAHLGVVFIAELRIGNIVDNYLVKRTNTHYKNVKDLKEKLKGTNPLDKESFLFQWFPFDASDKGTQAQMRISICERTNEVPTDATRVRPYKISEIWKKLMVTEAAESIIKPISESEKLRKFYPLITRAAAFDTFGSEEQTVEVGDVGTIMHPFQTYTDLEMSDVNPCITVKNTAEAHALWLDLVDICDQFYKETKALYQFNIVARLVRGIPDPEGKRGIAPCIVDNPGELKLNFEVLEHEGLAPTNEAKELRRRLFKRIQDLQFVLHHGKTPVEGLETLEKQFSKSDLSKKRLQGFREAAREVDPNGTLLTKNKKSYIFDAEIAPKEGKEKTLIGKQKGHEKPLDKQKEKQLLNHIVELSKEDPELLTAATKMLAE